MAPEPEEAITVAANGIDSVRTVALVGHGGAGKTSLAEAMLFLSKATPRLGSVDAGQSTLDYDSEEIKHKFTVNLSLAHVSHDNHLINIIDTPGYSDFVGDAVAGMTAAEIALFVVDAVSGPQVVTDRLWQIADNMNIARAFFVNRLDKENSHWDATVAALQERYGEKVVPVQIPIGREDKFRGVVDVIRMKAYLHDDKGDHLEDIPADLVDEAELARDALCDRTAEADDTLMEKYLEGERLSQEELEELLHLAIANGNIYPVFVGSATTLQGVEDLLDEIVAFFPRPKRHQPLLNTEGDEVGIDPSLPFSGLVFKTLSDPYVGRLSFVKVITGSLAAGGEVTNARTGTKARVPHLLRLNGKTTEEVDRVEAGDIVVIPKLTETLTNDTLAAGDHPGYAPISFPEPLYPVAIEAKTKADEDKLGTALKVLVDEDPSLHLVRSEETHQTVIYSIGDTAIDVLMSRLRDRYHVETQLVDLRIPYRETVRKSAQAQGRHKKQSGGSGQFGDCWLRVEPNPGGGYEFLDEIVGGRIPRQYIPAVDRGVQETMTLGVIAGYPMVDVKVAVYDGSYHAVDSNEMAFRTAARIGFRAAAELANPVILEPMATLDIRVPDHYSGAVMGDISSIRGRVLGTDSPAPGITEIKAQAPYAEVVHYSPHLRSISHGTGTYSITVAGYEQVPADTQKRLVEGYQKTRSEG